MIAVCYPVQIAAESGDLQLNWSSISEWLYRWQTLVTGGAAVIAAATSIWFLSKQVRQADSHEQARQRRRHAAARATLPLALSQICSYAETVARELDRLRHWLEATSEDPAPAFSRPTPPAELVASLERMIEATDDSKITGTLSDIIIEMQVLAANLESLGGNEGRRRSSLPNIDAYMVRAAKVHALASSLFAFARGEQESLSKIDLAAEVVRSLKLMHLNEHDHERAFALAGRVSVRARSGANAAD